jgi:hypothetical protein
VSRNVGYLSDSVVSVTPGVAITNSASLNDTLYSACGYFDHWEIVGYQSTSSATESNASNTTCGNATLGASFACWLPSRAMQGNSLSHTSISDWTHIDSFIQAIPAGFQYVPGTARVVYQRTTGHDVFTTTTQFVTPTFTVSGTDTIAHINLKSIFTGSSDTSLMVLMGLSYSYIWISKRSIVIPAISPQMQTGPSMRPLRLISTLKRGGPYLR